MERGVGAVKHLKIQYNDTVLFDGEVEEIVWSDGSAGVSVNGKLKRSKPSGGSGAGIFEKLAAASKQKTADAVSPGRAELNSESVSHVPEQ